MIDIVRQRMGIYYSEANKDAEIAQLILEAKADFESSGWPSGELLDGNESLQAQTAIIIHCLRAVGDIDDAKAEKILLGLQTKASFRKPEPNSDPEPDPDIEPDTEPEETEEPDVEETP